MNYGRSFSIYSNYLLFGGEPFFHPCSGLITCTIMLHELLVGHSMKCFACGPLFCHVRFYTIVWILIDGIVLQHYVTG